MSLSKSSYEAKRIEDPDFNLDLIAGLQEKADFWHGTGRFQWRYGSEDIGAGDDSSATIVDTLDGLIANGLKPHVDDFADKFGTPVTKSVSLTRARMYASVYARVFSEKGAEDLEYRYGSNLKWTTFYSIATLTALAQDKKVWTDWFYEHAEHVNKHGLSSAIRNFLSLQNAGMASQSKWTRNITRQKIPAWRALFSDGVSDIKDNYPILIGVPEDAVDELPASHAYLKAYETRTANAIPLKDCTHIEVPLSRISETRQRLNNCGIQLPVISIEDSDVLFSKKSLKELLRSDR